jgi:hypothetical protein
MKKEIKAHLLTIGTIFMVGLLIYFRNHIPFDLIYNIIALYIFIPLSIITTAGVVYWVIYTYFMTRMTTWRNTWVKIIKEIDKDKE